MHAARCVAVAAVGAGPDEQQARACGVEARVQGAVYGVAGQGWVWQDRAGCSYSTCASLRKTASRAVAELGMPSRCSSAVALARTLSGTALPCLAWLGQNMLPPFPSEQTAAAAGVAAPRHWRATHA